MTLQYLWISWLVIWKLLVALVRPAKVATVIISWACYSKLQTTLCMGMDAVPEEKSSTSRARNWGIPRERDFLKEPIMSTSVQRQLSCRGIDPTLYDPRSRDFKNDSRRRVGIMKETLQNVNQCIGFAHVIPPDDTVHKVETTFVMNPLGSVISYQLSPVEFNFQVYINTSAVGSNSFGDKPGTINLPDLRVKLFACDSDLSKWILSDKGEREIKHLQVTLPEAIAIEKATTEQRNCKEWFRARERRITASVVHRISVRKRQFENLASELAKHPVSINDMNDVMKKKNEAWHQIWVCCLRQIPGYCEVQGKTTSYCSRDWHCHQSIFILARRQSRWTCIWLQFSWTSRFAWDKMSRTEEEFHSRGSNGRWKILCRTSQW